MFKYIYVVDILNKQIILSSTIPKPPRPNPNPVQPSAKRKLVPKGLGLTLKSLGHHQLTFKHEGG